MASVECIDQEFYCKALVTLDLHLVENCTIIIIHDYVMDLAGRLVPCVCHYFIECKKGRAERENFGE